MSTYTPIASVTLTSDTSSVTIGNIPQTYTDLVIAGQIKGSQNTFATMQVGNGSVDTGSNYSVTNLAARYNSAISGNNEIVSERGAYSYAAIASGIWYSSTNFGTFIINLQNYSNTTTYKTILTRMSVFEQANYCGVTANVNLWRSTSAINIVTIAAGAGNLASGSTFNLYGIASASITNVAKATGGDSVTTDGTYWIHTFNSSGTFTPTQNLTCDALIVAGGGGTMGTTSNAGGFGGGGAGGLRSLTSLSITSGVATTVTVGAGGAGGAANLGSGSKGGNSTFDIYSATGGGIGSMSAGTHNGGAGGSGGGARTSGTGGLGNQGSYSPSEGNNGGITTAGDGAAGGGGAGAVGGNCTSDAGGNGGAGTASSITGTSVTYAGGGGGGGFNYAAGGTGGAGGGGNGKGDNTVPDNGTVNTGGGAGGSGGLLSGGTGRTGASGGSGIVIIRYPV